MYKKKNTCRYYNGEKYINGSMLSKIEGFLPGKTWIRISGENNLTPQNESNLTCVQFVLRL